MYGLYLSYWYAAAFFLVIIVVLSSLRPSRRAYWVALLAYTLLLFGSAAAVTFPMFFDISMANAFTRRSVSPLACIGPLLILAFAAAPALSLYPFVSLRAARRVAIVFFGTALVIATIYTLFTFYSLVTAPARAVGGPLVGLLILFLLLLWIRVYDLRITSEGLTRRRRESA